jgi:hypothetical protein
MKYIKIFEDFNNPLNENKTATLADGFYSLHISKDSEVGGPEHNDKLKTYFVTQEDTEFGHNISIEYNPPGYMKIVRFFPEDQAAGEFDDGKAKIVLEVSDFKEIMQRGGGKFEVPTSVWAKGPAEATAKAYEILARISHHLTYIPGGSKQMGNLVRSLFEFRKLYPAYASKNIMFKAFLDGIEKSYKKPDFGMYKGGSNYPWNKMKDDDSVYATYVPEFRQALMDAGVIAKPATPPATPA